MFRGLVLAVIVLMTPLTSAVQALGGLRIRVAIADENGRAMPVPRYRLQISDNPATAAPRRIMTSLEGVVDVRLAPGNYTVESERPVTVAGKTYRWTIVVDVVAGRDLVIELTSGNAEFVSPDSGTTATPTVEPDPSSLLAQWKDSLVAIWTATTHGSGFLIDANGLIAADHHVVGASASVEVQLSPSVKVAGTVIASDVIRGIALVSINPSAAASAKVLPPGCDAPPEPLSVGQEITALETPLGRRWRTSEGAIESVLPNAMDADLDSGGGGSGGPVFAPSGRLIGLTTLVGGREGQRADRTRVVRIGRLCELVMSAAETIKNTPPPSALHLPVESVRPFPSDSIQTAGRAASPSLYRLSSADFDVMFITPVQLLAPQKRSGGDQMMQQLLTDFGNWSEYVEAAPPVLLIRVTPKLTEGFWTKVARGAAMTQGVSIPPIKRLKPDFERMRALCGDAEVVPVHPFKLEHRLSDTDTLVEGLYAFDPGALAPGCGAVTLQLFSVKEPRKADTVIVDAKVIEQVWQDFAFLRNVVPLPSHLRTPTGTPAGLYYDGEPLAAVPPPWIAGGVR